LRFIFKPQYRSLVLVRVFNRHGVHQISNYTQHNRYPDLFELCRTLLEDKTDLKLLSFGCSYGDEVFSLRQYFPKARICGVDINRYNIRIANKKNTDTDLCFSSTIEESVASQGPYDAIFALAVLQRTENRTLDPVDSSAIYPFEKFNQTVAWLDRHLKPGGLFVIDHADYRFSDTDIAHHYTPCRQDLKIFTDRYLFGKDNRRLSERSAIHRVHIKTSA
jgi:SAM-dependent methyltransferase